MKLAVPRRGDSADMAYIEFVDRWVYQHIICLCIYACACAYTVSFLYYVFLFYTVNREGELRRARPPTPKGSQLVEMMERMGKLGITSNSSTAATTTEASK